MGSFSLRHKLVRLSEYHNYKKYISLDAGRKSWARLVFEILSYSSRDGFSKKDYMDFKLYRKSSGDLHAYFPSFLWYKFLDEISVPELLEVFDDKLKFHEQMVAHGLPTPRLLGVFRNGEFGIFNQDSVVNYDISQAEQAIANLRLLGRGRVFAKTIRGARGRGALLIDESMKARELAELLAGKEYLFQEYVRQHPDLAKINPGSLNTLRLLTVRDAEGASHVAGGFFRVGRGASIVDSAGGGGLANYLDLQSGKLDELSHLKYDFGGASMSSHPDTGAVFGDITLPFYSEAVALVHRAAAALPNSVVGWDVAITPEGPILIEGNRHPFIGGDQAIRGPYMQRPKLRELVLRHRGRADLRP